jgi:hypothetical protein
MACIYLVVIPAQAEIQPDMSREAPDQKSSPYKLAPE